MNEPNMTINGLKCSPAMVATIRSAIEGFAMQLQNDGLGNDKYGKLIKEAYLARIEEIRKLMAKC